ncbi:MAG: hypothetical protein [Hatfieldvirus porci]|uniref:Uncharacterized protein n=1 Tax=phage Lak_Megaphage_RVC_JS4_GC31 TaxID=3109228 RepID=A0ABZ0Z1N2_9CAUD|nr:MAG: hypothetical protein [phage Lak_Megaphage_RVC_AP3_GC31]WQJ53107.1 MAG: hypothetical protein [phage Lak_Megaphage_RVC_JS4_GC31]
MSNIKFFPMDHPDFWSRPQYLKSGYTFRNGGGEGDMVFTLLEDYNHEKDIKGNIKVLCHSLSTNYTHIETWDDCQYLKSSFDSGEYFPYWKYCDWLKEHYN